MPKLLSRTLVAGFVVLAFVSLAGCSKPIPAPEPTQSEQPPAEEPAAESPVPEAPAGMTDVTELKVEELEVGTGAEAKSGDNVSVHYTGWLTDGTMFESSLNSGQPIPFALGAGQVIPGWDQGIAGMKVGGKRLLTIPPDLAYGEQGSRAIPPNATLVFQVELVSIP